MRISTAQLFNQSIDSITRQQSELARTSEQLASGKRILTPSDDPAGAAQSLELAGAVETARQYQSNISAAQGRLQREESALASVGDSLQRVRELAVQANNAPLTDADRHAIGQEIRQRLDELVDLANTQDANGEYIFAGTKSLTSPFATDGAGAVSYQGDGEQRALQIGADRTLEIGDSGQSVFVDIANGNGIFAVSAAAANTGAGVIDAGIVTDPSAYTGDDYSVSFPTAETYEVRDSAGALVADGDYADGAAIAFAGIQTEVTGAPAAGDSFAITPSAQQDVFTTYANLATALETPAREGAGLNNAVNRALVDLDQALGHLNETRATVGARLQALDNQDALHADTNLQLQATLSEIQDLDYAEAVGRLQQQQAGLQAAQQTFVQLQGLSLFNFIR